MNWQTSIRVKDNDDFEHILLVATSIPQAEPLGIVDIFINELDSNGHKKPRRDMGYNYNEQCVVFPKQSEFPKKCCKRNAGPCQHES